MKVMHKQISEVLASFPFIYKLEILNVLWKDFGLHSQTLYQEQKVLDSHALKNISDYKNLLNISTVISDIMSLQ